MPGYELINNNELNAIKDIFKKGKVFFAHGFDKKRKKIYRVRNFEKKISLKLKNKYSLAVSSGTAAIKIALKSLNIGPGDQVITQPFNFIAKVEEIFDIGAIQIIANIDSTLNMCADDLKKKITNKTKAVIPVHMLGFPCDIEKLIEVKKKYKIPIIEDNCESMMSLYKKKFCGNLFDIGILSLDYGKFITTGEGGVILTNNKKIFDYCKSYHDHGHSFNNKNRGLDTAKMCGFNYRMTEIQAAIGLEQLKKTSVIINENKKRYLILKKIESYCEGRKVHKDTTPNFDTFIIKIKNKNVRKKIVNYLNKSIGTKNLPDALNWHDASNWKHIYDKKKLKIIKKYTNDLKECIAIPILIEQNLKLYKNISKIIIQIINAQK